jgi:hypothetical protein
MRKQADPEVAARHAVRAWLDVQLPADRQRGYTCRGWTGKWISPEDEVLSALVGIGFTMVLRECLCQTIKYAMRAQDGLPCFVCSGTGKIKEYPE